MSEMKCSICKKTNTVQPYTHKGCQKWASSLIERLDLLSARSVYEMLPAKAWARDDLRAAYNLGCRETEKEWHNLIGELKKPKVG